MRNALKQVFINQVLLENGSDFYCSIFPYKLIEELGNCIPVILEYNFTEKGE